MRFRPANISLINRRHYLPRLLLTLFSKGQMQKPHQRFEDVDRVTPYQGRVAGRHSGAIRVFRPAAGATRVHQFNTTLCPAATVAGRISLRSLTEYLPAGKETDRLTCFDASCVPEASSTA